MDPFEEYLLGIVQSIIDSLNAVFSFLYNLIQYIALILYNTLLGIVEFLYGLIKILISGLLHIVHDILTGDFADLWQDVQNLRAALAAYVDPIMRAIRAEQLFLQHLFNLYLKPVLAFIGALRNVARLLRAMGIKWAGTLDSYLGLIESKIITTYQTIVQSINRHADLFEWLLSPLGFVRIVPLLHIVALRSEDLARLFTGAPLSALMSGSDLGITPPLPTQGTASTFANLKAGIANGTGDAADWLAQFDAWGTQIDSDSAR